MSKPIIKIFHDESTFYANADRSFSWSDDKTQILKQKNLGQALMVSDFIEEVDGFLEYDDEPHYWRILSEYYLKYISNVPEYPSKKLQFQTPFKSENCLKAI